MYDIWSRNILDNVGLVQQDAGPASVIVVSGSKSDQAYWGLHLARTSRDVFRNDGSTSVTSVYEEFLRGNFLGTFNAWAEARPAMVANGKELPDVGLMSMVFGKGKRLSPFTQALGNRKAAFPTPLRAPNAGVYLRTVDLANLYSNTWIRHLADSGFRGMIVKWGDEAVIPGVRWDPGAVDLGDVDAVRFVWLTEITKDLAREKEWVVIDARTGLMKFQFSRQDLSTLQSRVASLGEGERESSRLDEVGVNLGSLAISYQFLDAALDVLGDDVLDPQKWANWDPYAWIALCCRDESQWRAEAAREDRMGRTGIRALEARYPDFYHKIAQVRDALEAKTGRPLAIATLDFGETFWTDLGLHQTLRRTMDALTRETDRGRATRALFGIPHDRDDRGNIVVGSTVPESADIRDSVIVDSSLLGPDSVIHQGVIIGGRHEKLFMPHGGCALFCTADHLVFTGPHGVAFRTIGSDVRTTCHPRQASAITIPGGGRHTSLLLPQGPEAMVSNESILDYSGQVYSQPVLGNRLSFEEAGQIMSRIDGQELERRWLRAALPAVPGRRQ